MRCAVLRRGDDAPAAVAVGVEIVQAAAAAGNEAIEEGLTAPNGPTTTAEGEEEEGGRRYPSGWVGCRKVIARHDWSGVLLLIVKHACHRELLHVSFPSTPLGTLL